MSAELVRATSELKDAFDELGIVLSKLPPRTGLTRFQTLQLCGLLIDLKHEYRFMCWELAFAAEQAIRSYGPQARLYVPWVFECEWDCSIERWRGFILPNEESHPINKNHVTSHERPDGDRP